MKTGLLSTQLSAFIKKSVSSCIHQILRQGLRGGWVEGPPPDPPSRWPRVPHAPCPKLSPTPFYLYITVTLRNQVNS